MADVKCPNTNCCLTIQNIPEGRQLIVTCPPRRGGCGTKFGYPLVETSQIALRCACDGTAVIAIFRRSQVTRKFVFDRSARVTSHGAEPAVLADAEYFDQSMFDWSNFYCAGCGHAPLRGEGYIVKCGRCVELICAAQVYPEASPTGEVKRFVCHPECGGEGILEANLKEVLATRTAKAAVIPIAALPAGPPTLRIK